MKPDQRLEEALAVIIASTRRAKRPKDIVMVSENISYAAQRMGGLKAVAETVGLSIQQLKDFLAVKKLSKNVCELVAGRKIDSVDVVKTISGLPHDKQKILADHLIEGRITSKDVRNIVTFAKRFPNKPMSKVIVDYEKSKDVRVYVAKFRVPAGFSNKVELMRRFKKFVERREIKSLLLRNGMGVLELNDIGYERLRAAVRKNKTTLRRFVELVVEGAVGRK